MQAKKRIAAANYLLIFYVAAVIYSGFAYPLHYGRGFWPFNRDWFMFSFDPGYDYELQALGETDKGLVPLDVSPYFEFPVADHGSRFQEVPRDVDSMRKLARFLCGKFHVKSITLNEFNWPRPAGRRLKREEVDPAKLNSSTWINAYLCN